MKAKAKEDADRILAHVYEHVDALNARPQGPAKQFAAAGLMRCCTLLEGILVLGKARMPELAGSLIRLHWETWLVSLYVLLGGDEALEDIKRDYIFWSRKLSESLHMEEDHHHPDLKPKKLIYSYIHQRVLELLRERREPVDGPKGITGRDVTYLTHSLFSAHANFPTIGRHLVEKDDGCLEVSVDSSRPLDDDFASEPVIYTRDLAQRVFEEFDLDGDAMNFFRR